MRISCRYLALSIVSLQLAILSPTAQANDGRELAQEILGLHGAIARLEKLSRFASRISYVESVALLSEQGKWKHEKGNWPEEATSPFFYDVFKSSERIVGDVKYIEKSLQRDKALNESERSEFAAIITDLQLMLKDSNELYDLLHAGKIDEANAFYRDRIRERYLAIQNASFTLGLTLEERITKAGYKVRLLK